MKKISIFILLCFVRLVFISAQNSTDPTLIARWHFNEISGTSTANTGYNYNIDYNGTLHNMNTSTNGGCWVRGKFGNAIQFNQTPSIYDHVSFLNEPSPISNGNITISGWIKIEPPTIPILNMQILMGTKYQIYCSAPDNSQLYNLAFRTQTNNNDAIQDVYSFINRLKVGKWYNIVCISEAGSTGLFKTYVNGVKVDENKIFGNQIAPWNWFHFGSEGDDGTKTILDEFEIYNYALSDITIKEKYESARIIFHFEEGTGYLANDVALTDEYANN